MISSLPKWVNNLFENSLRPNVKVLFVSDISSQIKKVSFQGDISKMNFQVGYANVIRVSETEYRNYTVAHHDIAEGILEIIFYIHGNGVGCRYINTLREGDEIYISLPRGRNEYDPKVKQQFIFGDETSLGIACSFLPVLKQNGHQFQFYFELGEENKEAPGILGLENFTVFSKNGLFRNEKWIKDLPILKASDWQEANFILTGNVKSVQVFRKVLKETATGKILSKGYWLEGKKGL
ncbi:siderophore-interacting protein [Pedobacter sp. MR22-3]|uniref:siderophore-interacting protein n=1 Tax=Pedobacter sp. MR22-3 TaxID=2994552 RepID=UPI002245E75F|nr:FAD-binding oxidoreductase [Pedobacter sp. MR22-3]MCX2584383.1 FAD-binding oxidoreductase [Pedobacter sp. MR22-3]